MLFLCLVILDFDYDRSLKHIFCLSCKFYFPGDISCGGVSLKDDGPTGQTTGQRGSDPSAYRGSKR